MKIAAICLVGIALAGVGAESHVQLNPAPQGAWRNIQLLRSKPADVENLLRQPSQSSGYVRMYSLDNYELWVDYYPFDHCRPTYGKTGQWNIPEWTVTEIVYVPGGSVDFSSLKLDLKEYRKVRESPHVPAMISYVNDSEGVDYTLDEDGKTLHSIRYFPSSSFQRLRCEEK